MKIYQYTGCKPGYSGSIAVFGVVIAQDITSAMEAIHETNGGVKTVPAGGNDLRVISIDAVFNDVQCIVVSKAARELLSLCER